MTDRVREFSLPNVGPGSDPFSLSALDEEIEFVVLFFQRDHYCTNCREQVQAVADRYEAFRSRGAEVVSIVPEPVENVREWQTRYELPYPLLADPDAEVGDTYDQPVRYGVLGRVSDFFGRMPAVVVVDRRGPELELGYAYEGSSTFDRPAIDDLIAELDELGGEQKRE